jgi:hypothetical protein
MAKKPREMAGAFCECEGIISAPQSGLVLETHRFGRKCSPSMNTNNPLAVEPETENDAGCENFFDQRFSNVLVCSGGCSDKNKDFLK